MMFSADEAISQILERQPRLIGIDGLPCSGKTTLAISLVERMNAEYLGLDDFVIVERDWPKPCRPAYPFPYIRHQEFLEAIKTIAGGAAYTFHPFDWSVMGLSPQTRTIPAGANVVIEGVSALDPQVASVYDETVFVVSDATTTLQSAIERGGGAWLEQWRDYFMPSVEIYFRTEPAARAAIKVRGRGA